MSRPTETPGPYPPSQWSGEHGGAGGYGTAPGYGTESRHGAQPDKGAESGYGPPGGGVPPYPSQAPAQPIPYDYTAPTYNPAPPAGTDGFAIASLVVGLCGGWVLGLVFGIVALVRIKKSRAKGKGLAIAGIVISGLGIGATIGALVWVVLSGVDRSPSGEVVDGGTISVTDLKPGDCVNNLVEDELVSRVDAVPCSQPHDAEVFAVYDLPGSAWPGQSTVDEGGYGGCQDRLADYAPAAADDDALEIFYFTPTEESWRSGDREVACLALEDGVKRSGSIRD